MADNDNDNEIIEMSMKEATDKLNSILKEEIEKFVKLGCKREEVYDFFCLRFHQLHLWGILACTIDGKPGVAIMAGTGDKMKGRVAFVTARPDMKITSLYGVDMKEDMTIDLTPHRGPLN